MNITKIIEDIDERRRERADELEAYYRECLGTYWRIDVDVEDAATQFVFVETADGGPAVEAAMNAVRERYRGDWGIRPGKVTCLG